MLCPVEINGFGIVNFDNPQVILLEDVFILDQMATPGSVETDPLALGRYMHQMHLDGGDSSKIKFQWHSHVQMPPFFSAVDKDNIENWPGDWLVSLVLNQRGEFECRYDSLRPLRFSQVLEPVIDVTVTAAVADELAKEVAGKVKQPRWGGLGTRSLTDGSVDPDAWTPTTPQFLNLAG